MRVLITIMGSLILLSVAAFCVFGFMATFEPTDRIVQFMAFRIGYFVIGIGSLVAIMPLIARCFRKR